MPPTQPNFNTEEEQPPQRHPCPAGSDGPCHMLEVYDPDFLHVVFIPADKVVHTPPKSLGVTRLVLCRNFDEKSADAPSCTKGPACKFVHALVEGCRKQPIHVNYAWRSIDAVTYPRLPAGETLSILAPNERPPADEIPSERVLLTRGSANRRDGNRTMSHCAHYYFNRMCNRGERCNFVHTAYIQPNATAWQRAPAPTAVAPLHRPTKQGTGGSNGNSGGNNTGTDTSSTGSGGSGSGNSSNPRHNHHSNGQHSNGHTSSNSSNNANNGHGVFVVTQHGSEPVTPATPQSGAPQDAMILSPIRLQQQQQQQQLQDALQQMLLSNGATTGGLALAGAGSAGAGVPLLLNPHQGGQLLQQPNMQPFMMLMPTQAQGQGGYMPMGAYGQPMLANGHHQQHQHQQQQQPHQQIVYQPIYVPVAVPQGNAGGNGGGPFLQPHMMPFHHQAFHPGMPQPQVHVGQPMQMQQAQQQQQQQQQQQAAGNGNNVSMTSFYQPVVGQQLAPTVPPQQQQMMPQVQVGNGGNADMSASSRFGMMMNWSHHGNLFNQSSSTISTASSNFWR
jgi:hypothetical protein